MTAQKPYREYKDSGVEWVGIHPQHWSVELVKRSAYVKARVGWKGLTSDEFEDAAHAYLVTGTDFQGKFIDWRNCYQVSRERYEDDPYIQLQNGDLLITKDGTIGKLAVVRDLDKPACLNSGIFVVRPLQSLSSDYLYWVLESAIFRQFVRATSTGSTILHLYQNVFVQFAFPYPPVEEQRAIASYLDHETAEIDAFIADQQELIGLLNERRSATITQAVTKGLDPNVPMKDSGVEWLGAVPAHWDVDKATRIGRVFGSEAVREEDVNSSSGVPFLKVSSLAREGFEPYPPEWFVGRGRVTAVGDFIAFPKRGAAIFTNKVNIVREPAALDPNLMGWKLTSSCDLTYFAYVLQLMRLEEIADVSTVPQINTKHIAALRLPKPPTEEQLQIASYLHRETAEIDAAIADAKEAIELSKERRAALISAAVTGKIDVRDHPAATGAA